MVKSPATGLGHSAVKPLPIPPYTALFDIERFFVLITSFDRTRYADYIAHHIFMLRSIPVFVTSV